ncbi:MAG TPA: Crp/Fnr family transcriptional regulator [Burkholderiales bacterium]|nr:Crp/Fnr family transcriptional regulator [Burkholderiales bacterium]
MLRSPIHVRDFLASLPLFKDIHAVDLRRIAERIESVDAPKGTVLAQRGQRCAGFYVVVYGHVKLALQTQRGNEKIVEILGRGQTFGEFAMFLDQQYLTTAEAIADSKLLYVSKSTVMEEIEREPAFARRMILALSRRLSLLFGVIEGYTVRNGTQRVGAYLLSQMAEPDDLAPAQIILPVQKGVIASHLNLTHEHFSRILHDLAAAGLIEVRGRAVRILDSEKLRGLTA